MASLAHCTESGLTMCTHMAAGTGLYSFRHQARRHTTTAAHSLHTTFVTVQLSVCPWKSFRPAWTQPRRRYAGCKATLSHPMFVLDACSLQRTPTIIHELTRNSHDRHAHTNRSTSARRTSPKSSKWSAKSTTSCRRGSDCRSRNQHHCTKGPFFAVNRTFAPYPFSYIIMGAPSTAASAQQKNLIHRASCVRQGLRHRVAWGNQW